ncbi:PVC-type heme-binding CxxCH protein [Allorhodopirellula solitaria]|uniref:Cytochrome c n=1 Tax=Allorhodopirellula solitaria TaxID=2527987 RepID=A0A5C5XBE7_9BACT|nr:PVC-type heme-binding CxxCH protein [Allorhodopirellula solitaria]TWT59232.1 Cytochrome c [Allorhodopirellula solitaria]
MNFISAMFYALLASNARRLDDLRNLPGEQRQRMRRSAAWRQRSLGANRRRCPPVPGGPLGAASLMLVALFLCPIASTAEPADPSPTNSFPALDNTEPLAASHPQLPPAASAAAIKLPAGFSVAAIAAEPDVQNPIDLAWDYHGRLWIAENYTYAKSGVRFRDDLRDRVVVFTDADGDGIPEHRDVFMDTLTRLTSVEVGPGPGGVNGVWLMCPPQLLFVPDADHDLTPDGPPQVILDGFEIAQQNYHNFANGLRFGPDGWLYGRCGGSCPGRIGQPGTADEDRVALEGGVWRCDIDSDRFEVICHGTTNPWGHDFTRYGDLFFINTVNGHLWHGFEGAHFRRPFTLDPNPAVYETIDQHADHYHFDTGQHWTKSRDGAANDFGGGHAHTGMMIYQESTWPQSYRGSLMTLNFHGRRANRENLVRRRSGYVGTHGKDFFLTSDEWFRGIELSAGPDGNVFLLDWSDLGECHEHTGVHRSSGRIYHITADHSDKQQQRLQEIQLRRIGQLIAGDAESLVEMILENDRWYSHQALMRLRELRDSGVDLTQAINRLQSQTKRQEDPACRCRILWALDVLAGIDDYESWFADPSEYVRAAAIRSSVQDWPLDDVYGPTADSRAAWPRMEQPARSLINAMEKLGAESSPLIRRNLASTLQRLPASLRAEAAGELLRFSGDQDVGDHNLPKLIWYGLMSRSSTVPDDMIGVLQACEIPELTTYLARSIAEQAESSPQAFAELQQLALKRYREQASPAPSAWCNTVLTGVEQGLVGIRQAPKSNVWPQLRSAILAASPGHQPLVDRIDTLYGDGLSAEQLRAVLDDRDAEPTKRLAALRGCVAAWLEKAPHDAPAAEGLAASARPLIADPHVNLAAAESLARVEHPAVAEVLLSNYGRFRAPLRPNVVSLLCAREVFALALIEQIERGRLPKEALTASHVRSIAALGNDALIRRIETVWGRVRETPDERLGEIARWKTYLTPERLRDADRSAGRTLFDRTCATCHKMFGNGEQIGPDLTGSQRNNLDYLLSNIVDPDAVVGADFRATKVLTADGRLLVGLITQRTRQTLTIVSASNSETIPVDEVEEEIPTDQSPMPSGLLQPFTDQQVVDLMGYLQSPIQVSAETP